MLDVRYFLANLLCVFIPLFGIEIWWVRAEKSPKQLWRLQALLVGALLLSSFLCTMFNFPISSGITLNLSIVPLAIGFFLLSWPLGLLVLGLYIISQVVLTIFLLGHDAVTFGLILHVLQMIPHAIVPILMFALMMTICSVGTQNWKFNIRAATFVGSLFLYTLFDFAYVHYEHHFSKFEFMPFAGFILVFNATFVFAVRILVFVHEAHQKRMDALRIEKLELVSQLAASIAHEIRNPITVVQGFTQLMLKDDYDKERIREFHEKMLQELARAESVISDYLDLAKQPIKNDQSEFNFSLLVDHVVDVLRPYAASKNVDLQAAIEGDLNVFGNQVSMTQAVMNLVKNGIEAHDHSGKVKVSLTPLGDQIQLKITDFGRGIAASTLPKLGQPYYSTKSQGTGLGLTMVYKVVNDIGGDIEVKSQEGKGATFTVKIPRARNSMKMAAYPASVSS